jgi:hypothetical protein
MAIDIAKYRKEVKNKSGESKTYLAFKAGSFGQRIVTQGRAAGYNMEAVAEEIFKQSGLDKVLLK